MSGAGRYRGLIDSLIRLPTALREQLKVPVESLTAAVLLSWASHLSGYPAPEVPPAIQFEPHAFFVEHACGGRDCRVVGWYNDENVVFIDEKHRDDDSSFAASLVVHELVHFLQHQSGNFDSHSCEDSLAREREAYNVQNRYIIEARASFALVRPGPFNCAYDKPVLASESPHPQADVPD